MSTNCVFCDIIRGSQPAHVVYQDAATVAFLDLRQFHAGHTLVVPRDHVADVRDLTPDQGGALMATVSRITRAVGQAFPNEGLSLWHSIGPAAFQEVPHLHIHVHPRKTSDDFLRVYPGKPPTVPWMVLGEYAAKLRQHL